MKNWRKASVNMIMLVALLIASQSQANMLLSFDSSDQSWVGQGQSFTISPTDGYIFTGGVSNYDNSLYFFIYSLNSPFGPNFDPGNDEYHYWSLDLAAPYDMPLEIGHYDNTARYPFQDDSQPGLTFSGDHRGNNRNSGLFDVLDISLDGAGKLNSFAANFTQFDEEKPDWWINGQLRFNSDIPLAPPVPEPSTVFLLSIGFGGLLCNKIRRKKLRGSSPDRNTLTL